MKKKYLMIGFAVLLNFNNSKGTNDKIIGLENNKELIAVDMSIKDEYNLVGVNARLNVRFNKKSNELILILNSEKTIIFRKLE